MDKLEFDYLNTDDETASKIMADTAKKYIETLNLSPFNPEGLEWARSEKEINKCKMIRDRLKERELRKTNEKKKDDSNSENKRKTEISKAKKIFKKQGGFKSKNFKKRK